MAENFKEELLSCLATRQDCSPLRVSLGFITLSFKSLSVFSSLYRSALSLSRPPPLLTSLFLGFPLLSLHHPTFISLWLCLSLVLFFHLTQSVPSKIRHFSHLFCDYMLSWLTLWVHQSMVDEGNSLHHALPKPPPRVLYRFCGILQNEMFANNVHHALFPHPDPFWSLKLLNTFPASLFCPEHNSDRFSCDPLRSIVVKKHHSQCCFADTWHTGCLKIRGNSRRYCRHVTVK